MSGRQQGSYTQTQGGQGQKDRTNQCNPTHAKTGPGHQAAYGGTGTRSDLNNHANQGNPNNPRYQGGGAAGKK